MTERKGTKNNDDELQNTTQKTKHRTTRIPLKTGGELRCFRLLYATHLLR